MISQARTGDTVLAVPNTAVVAVGRWGEDDRKQSTLALLVKSYAS